MDDSEYTLLFIKVDGHLLPASAEAAAVMQKLPLHTEVELQFHIPRNAKHHRKWRALVDTLHNAGVGQSKKHLEDRIKIACGWFDTVILEDGTPEYRPRSTSFSAMGQVEFDAFFLNVEKYVIDRILPDLEDADLRKAVMEFF